MGVSFTSSRTPRIRRTRASRSAIPLISRSFLRGRCAVNERRRGSVWSRLPFPWGGGEPAEFPRAPYRSAVKDYLPPRRQVQTQDFLRGRALPPPPPPPHRQCLAP